MVIRDVLKVSLNVMSVKIIPPVTFVNYANLVTFGVQINRKDVLLAIAMVMVILIKAIVTQTLVHVFVSTIQKDRIVKNVRKDFMVIHETMDIVI